MNYLAEFMVNKNKIALCKSHVEVTCMQPLHGPPCLSSYRMRKYHATVCQRLAETQISTLEKSIGFKRLIKLFFLNRVPKDGLQTTGHPR